MLAQLTNSTDNKTHWCNQAAQYLHKANWVQMTGPATAPEFYKEAFAAISNANLQKSIIDDLHFYHTLQQASRCRLPVPLKAKLYRQWAKVGRRLSANLAKGYRRLRLYNRAFYLKYRQLANKVRTCKL